MPSITSRTIWKCRQKSKRFSPYHPPASLAGNGQARGGRYHNGTKVELFYANQVQNLPYGLERVLLGVLKGCIGQEKALTRETLLSRVRLAPAMSKVSDRQLRKAVQNLREKGVRVCSPLDGDGFFIAASEDEYQSFRAQYSAYAKTIWQTIRAMDERRSVPITDEDTLIHDVERRAGAVQPGLFGG